MQSTGRQFRFAKAVLIFFALCGGISATTRSDYQNRLTQAINALDSLAYADETESGSAYDQRSRETVAYVARLLPEHETIEVENNRISVDNSWLHTALDDYDRIPARERAQLRQNVIERLHALADHIKETDQSGAIGDQEKQQHRKKLDEILQRPEYKRKIKEEGALGRLINRFLRWLQSLIPKPKPFAPGTASIFSKLAQIFVLLLAAIVLIVVARMFLPRLLKASRKKQKAKVEPRIVLGEELQPDESAKDLLAEAEMLARSGDLRAAMRKAYIALLVELGDRKIISLAQHKTNYDYLRAVRRIERLYPNVKVMTDSFEKHWYGLASVTDSDWQQFRATYKQALSS